MKKIAVFVAFFLVALAGWSSDWTGAGMWKSSSDPIIEVGGFQQGYFEALKYAGLWSESDLKAWGLISLQVGSGMELKRAVDRFYDDPANGAVSPSRAMRTCLEALIAKTHDGPRLLAAIGVKADPVALR